MIYIQSDNLAPWVVSDSKEELLYIGRILHNTFGNEEYIESVFTKHSRLGESKVIGFAIIEDVLNDILTQLRIIGEVSYITINGVTYEGFVSLIEKEYGVTIANCDEAESGLRGLI